MGRDVKGRSGAKQKPARGSRRDQARATRRAITDAAFDLFLRHGYAATTLNQIAAEAGVAVQTVYFHFGNKATVLKEVVDFQSVGDDEPVPVLERPWMRRFRDEPDGDRALAIWLRNSRHIFARVSPLMKIIRDAAGTDSELATQWQVNQEQRFLAHRTLAELLDAKQALRSDLSVKEAADILFTVVSLEVYQLLTVERGWSPTRWERWTHHTLATTVLR
ncbi:TetR/AcrR family transcriptional regulator [Flindersiella endophytica]